jgi:integrase
MSWVEKRQGKQAVTYRVHWRDPSGHLRNRSFKTERAARTFAVQVEAAKLEGTYRDPAAGSIKLSDLETEWRRRAPLAASSLALHDAIWRKWVGPALGDRSLKTITKAVVRAFLDDVHARSGSAWTVQSAHRVVRKLLQEAVDGERIARNPALRLNVPKPRRKRITVLTPGEIDRLSKAMPVPWQAFVYVVAYGALRFSEAAALRLDDVDWLRRTIRIDSVIVEASGHLTERAPKTEAGSRTVVLPGFVVEYVSGHVALSPPGPAGLLFHDGNGNAIRRSTFYRSWRPACIAAGLEGFNVRNLRHTGASLAIAAGADVEHLAGRLGHSSSSVTSKIYTEIFEGRDREIADRLERLAHDPDAQRRLRG